MNDDAHIDAMRRRAEGFGLARPQGRMHQVRMTEAARRRAVEQEGRVRLPRLGFLEHRFDWEGRP